MTTENTDMLQERPLLTDEDIAALNAARTILERLADEATSRAWKAPSRVGTSLREVTAQALGRVAGVAKMAEDNVFDVMNVASSDGMVRMTDDQLHNRPTAELYDDLGPVLSGADEHDPRL